MACARANRNEPATSCVAARRSSEALRAGPRTASRNSEAAKIATTTSISINVKPPSRPWNRADKVLVALALSDVAGHPYGAAGRSVRQVVNCF